MFPLFELVSREIKSRILELRHFTKNLSKEEFAYKVLPLMTLEIIRRYFRVEVEGTENIPARGRAIVISNHSGYEGFDALMLANEIRRARHRIAHLVAHKLWFLGNPVRVLSEKMGFVEADTNACLELLNKNKLLVLFPEGEEGNFKPSHKRYRLQTFRRGFVRLAMITQAPVIPAMVIGAEESQINLGQLRWTKYVFGTVTPLPLNIIPLPVKWKIRFLPPILFENYRPEEAMDRTKVLELSRKIRRDLQRAILAELRLR